MAALSFRFRIAPLVAGTYALDGDALVYRQGVRSVTIALAQVRAFAVRQRPAFLGLASSQLVFQLETGDPRKPTRLRKTLFDPATPDGRALLDALRARLPAADATGARWPAAAARLGVVARPWYEGFLQPRTTIGIVLLGATAAANADLAETRDRYELLGRGLVGVTVTIVAVVLIVSGVRRARAQATR